MKAAKTSGTALGNLKAVTYSMGKYGTGVNRFLQPGTGGAKRDMNWRESLDTTPRERYGILRTRA